MLTIFDTDFQADDSIFIYKGGRFVYEGTIADMSEDLKAACNWFTWHLLDSIEGARAVFIG